MTHPTPADPALVADYHNWDREVRRLEAQNAGGNLKTTADLHGLHTARRRRAEAVEALGFAPLPPNVSTLIATATAQLRMVRETIEALERGEFIDCSQMQRRFDGGVSTLRQAYDEMTAGWVIAAQDAPAQEAA